MTDHDSRANSTALLLDAMAQKIAAGGITYEEAASILRIVYDRGMEDDAAIVAALLKRTFAK